MSNYQPLTLPTLKTKKIAILGLAREGISTYTFIRQHLPEVELTLIDQLPISKLQPTFQQQLASDPHQQFIQLLPNHDFDFDQFDLVFKSAGIPNHQYHISPEKLTSNTQLFFDLVKGITIGVTGTKGKSTTTSVIAQVLKSAGKKIELAGNIGLPLLEGLTENSAETFYVCELSSHQLEYLHTSPQIGVLQAIAPEHLDYYQNFAEYINAKASICKYQQKNDWLFFNADNREVNQLVSHSLAQKFPFGLKHHDRLDLHDQEIWLDGEKFISLPETKLRGLHNLLNLMPAILIADQLKIDHTIIKTALTEFKPLEHRLELVASLNGVEYFNDSLATNPPATIAAIDAFAQQPIILITGGFDRGLDYQTLSQKIDSANIKKLIVFPDTGKKIIQNLTKRLDYVQTESMLSAVKLAADSAQKGDIVLMSPASASFNLFIDYADRGNQFKKAVKDLAI